MAGPTLTARILERIRCLLFLSDMSQREVEKRLGFSRGYLSQLLAGTIELKYWQLMAILRTIDLEPSDFFAELFPSRRYAALDELDDFSRQARRTPLSLELARLYAFGIESILDLCDRLERCEAALDELIDLGLLARPEGRR